MNHLVPLLLAAVLLTLAQVGWCADAPVPPLPEGPGLAAKYPGDVGLEKDPTVILVENFESGALDPKRWEDVRGADHIHFTTEPANVKSGKYACEFVCDQQVGDATAKTWFMPGHDTVFVRWYVKFAEDIGGTSHVFSTPIAQLTTDKWGWTKAGGAGKRPIDAFWTTFEPVHSEEAPLPGVWHFYTYWPEMHSHETPEGKGETTWGNNFSPSETQPVAKGRWLCMEVMLKANTPGKYDGEQAAWIDGKLVARFGPGVPVGYWLRDRFFNDPSRQPFEGYNWRTKENVKINCYSMGLYISKAEVVSRMWYDDVVLATQYIGPQTPEVSAGSKQATE